MNADDMGHELPWQMPAPSVRSAPPSSCRNPAPSLPCFARTVCAWTTQWRVRARSHHCPRVKQHFLQRDPPERAEAVPAPPANPATYPRDCAVQQAGLLPRVWELQVGHVEDPFPVGAVVVIHKFLELHLAVFLLGDISDVNTPLWSYKSIRWEREMEGQPDLPHFVCLGVSSHFKKHLKSFDFLVFLALVSSLFMSLHTRCVDT